MSKPGTLTIDGVSVELNDPDFGNVSGEPGVYTTYIRPGSFTVNFNRQTSVRDGYVLDMRYVLFIDGDGKDWHVTSVLYAKRGRHVRYCDRYTVSGEISPTLEEAVSAVKKTIKRQYRGDPNL